MNAIVIKAPGHTHLLTLELMMICCLNFNEWNKDLVYDFFKYSKRLSWSCRYIVVYHYVVYAKLIHLRIHWNFFFLNKFGNRLMVSFKLLIVLFILNHVIYYASEAYYTVGWDWLWFFSSNKTAFKFNFSIKYNFRQKQNLYVVFG